MLLFFHKTLIFNNLFQVRNLSELYKTAEKHNLDIVKTRRKLWFEDGKVIEKNNLNKKITKGLKKNIPLFLLFSYEHTTAIYRKDLVTNHQIAYPSIRSSEDTLFLLNITYYAKNFRLISGPCYYYRQRQSSLTGKISQEYFNDMLCWFNEVLDFGANHKISGMDRNYFLFHAFNHMHLLSNKVSQNQVLQEYAKEFNAKILKITGKHPYASDWLIRSFINNMSFRLTRYRILLKSCLPQAKP